ncbi:hypothetical protein [Streptomyces sp. NPDC057682]|uniref:hypothetical protein n=1 Tax=unclassified Streptomyces TaxID=2593676 RepID=UPI00364CA36D
MTAAVPETVPAPAAEPVPAAAPAPEAVPESAPPVRRSGVRRVVLAAVPVVLVLAAVAGAAVYTKATVDGADRTVPTSLWYEDGKGPGPDPAGDVSRGRTTTELSRLLLPVPRNFRLGPDSGVHGNDSELSGRAATAEMKESARGLAGKQRRELEKRIDKLRVQGLAIRTYAQDTNDLVVKTELVRMKDTKAVRDLYTTRTGLFEAVGFFRKGPKVAGHTRTARCFLAPKEKESGVERMTCMAFDGEITLTFTASGTKPFDASAVVGLVKDQLDHLTSPGEYV